MSKSQKELEEVLDLLKIEMEEDRVQYQYKMQNMSLDQRKEEGFTWYPIVIKDTYYGMGERLIVEVERPSDKENPSQFQTGKIVKLFSNAENDENAFIAGVISAVRQNFLKIVFFADELPDWSGRGKLGVELMFDETSYKEMEATIKEVIKAKNNRIAELREVLLGHKKPSVFVEQEDVSMPSLNESQNQALNNVLKAADVAIIHGPPGTGKTTTLVASIEEVLKEEDQVLVTAASNTAVDVLTEKLAEKGIRVLRMGNPARVSEDQLQHTVDIQVSNHKDYKRIKELRKSANDYRNVAQRYKRQFGKAEREQRKMLFKEARNMAEEAVSIENYIIESLVENAQVITCTLVGSANYVIRERTYSTVFIDEAAQALEPACWIPLLRADRVVFAGDHKQLPPTVKSFEASKGGLSVTLFEKCIERQDVDVMLTTQYRMNENIMKFSNKEFYENKLKAAPSVANHLLAPIEKSQVFAPVEFIDTSGCGYHEEVDPRTLSTFNKEEAQLLLKHFKGLLEEMVNQNISLKGLTAGIIAPYRAQKEVLLELVEGDEFIESCEAKVTVNTVDGFQGQEKDIMYISLVRSNESGEIGFLSDTRRMNVALTRARKKLVVIGDSATLGQNAFYQNFLDYIEDVKGYRSAWEYIS